MVQECTVSVERVITITNTNTYPTLAPCFCLFSPHVSTSVLPNCCLLFTFITMSHEPPARLCSRAADWKLDAPDWTGRMRLTARGKVAYVKLEDKISGKREGDRTWLLYTGTSLCGLLFHQSPLWHLSIPR